MFMKLLTILTEVSHSPVSFSNLWSMDQTTRKRWNSFVDQNLSLFSKGLFTLTKQDLAKSKIMPSPMQNWVVENNIESLSRKLKINFKKSLIFFKKKNFSLICFTKNKYFLA